MRAHLLGVSAVICLQDGLMFIFISRDRVFSWLNVHVKYIKKLFKYIDICGGIEL